MLRAIYEKIEKIVSILIGIGSLSLIFIIAIIFFNIIMRYLLKKSYVSTVECLELAMLVTVSIGVVYCTLKEGHIKLCEITKWSLLKRFIRFLEGLLTAALAGATLKFGIELFVVHYQTTMVLEVPIFPFVIFVGFCFILLFTLLLLSALSLK